MLKSHILYPYLFPFPPLPTPPFSFCAAGNIDHTYGRRPCMPRPITAHRQDTYPLN